MSEDKFDKPSRFVAEDNDYTITPPKDKTPDVDEDSEQDTRTEEPTDSEETA